MTPLATAVSWLPPCLAEEVKRLEKNGRLPNPNLFNLVTTLRQLGVAREEVDHLWRASGRGKVSGAKAQEYQRDISSIYKRGKKDYATKGCIGITSLCGCPFQSIAMEDLGSSLSKGGCRTPIQLCKNACQQKGGSAARFDSQWSPLVYAVSMAEGSESSKKG